MAETQTATPSAPPLGSRPAAWHFLALAVLLFWFGRTGMFRDPGTFWHTAAGRTMLESGRLLHSDPYSFTFAGRPWTAQSWLPELTAAIAHRLAGWDGLLLLAVTLLAAVYASLARRFMQAGLEPMPATLALALVLAAGAPQFHVRPLLATTALLYLTVAVLVDIEARRQSPGRLFWLLPAFVLWVNCHGGVLAGIGSAAIVVAAWLVLGYFQRGPLDTVRRRWAAVGFVLLMGLTVLANPYGMELPRDWLRILSLPLGGIIEEHAPLAFDQPVGWIVAAIALAYVGTLVSTWPQKPRTTWFLPLIWLALACQRGRNAQLFALVAGIAWADMLPYCRWLRSPVQKPDGHASLVSSKWLAVCCLLPLAVVPAAGWVQFDRGRWPMELLPAIEEIAAKEPPGTPVLNDMTFGGFLIWHAPRLRVFIDDRCELYGGEFLKEYDDARRRSPGTIEQWRRQYGSCYALVEADGGFDRYLAGDPRWILIARCNAAAFYRRSDCNAQLSSHRAPQ